MLCLGAGYMGLAYSGAVAWALRAIYVNSRWRLRVRVLWVEVVMRGF